MRITNAHTSSINWNCQEYYERMRQPFHWPPKKKNKIRYFTGLN